MSRTGTIYGGALYSLCQEENLTESVLQELEVLGAGISDAPDFLRLLSEPNVPVQERLQIVDDCFRDKVHPYVLNFLKLLTEKGLCKAFPDCVRAYIQQYNDDHDILPVTAVTAIALTPAQAERLTHKLSGLTGKQIQLTNRVDAACVGGVVLDYDGKRVDGSVAGRLESIRSLLKNTVL